MEVVICLLILTMLFSLCSQTLADCDDLDGKLSTSDDYFNEQEEELRHRVQLEAEERKLEETLEYQRRIEEEAKQKHLAEQCRSTYASSVIGTTRFPTIGSQDNHESAPNNSSCTYLEGIKFGDFTENNFSQKLNGLDSSDAQALTSSDMTVSKLTLKMNGVWKNAQPIKPLSNLGTQNSKSYSEPQKKYFQGCGLCTALRAFTITSVHSSKMDYYMFIVAGVPGAIYDDDDNGRATGPQFGSKAPRWSSYQAGKQNQLHVLPSDDPQFVHRGHSAGTEKADFEKGSYFHGSINLCVK